MYAVIETGGKQLKVEPGRFIDIEKIVGDTGKKVIFKNISLISDNGDLKVGNPILSNAAVHGHIVEQSKKKKVIVYKMRPKKGYERKQGHRQLYSRVFIDNIELDGKKIAEANEASAQKAKSK